MRHDGPNGANVRVGGAPPRRAGARPRAFILGAAAFAGALAGCVRTTTVSYLPSPERPRLSLTEGERMLARYLSIECGSAPERAGASAEARVRVAVDSVGDVTSSMLERSTGNAQADALVGAVTAQLKLAALPPGAGQTVVRASYRCDPAGGATATLLHP